MSCESQDARAFTRGGIERMVGAGEAKTALEIDIVDASGLEPVAPIRARAARRQRFARGSAANARAPAHSSRAPHIFAAGADCKPERR